ncbi:MAG: sulfurtransferase-like selenium metabolism protein YedF, partial [Candidatus Saccharibacteria bacterium]
GTCLDFYGLKDKLGAGKATNMYTIMENLTNSSKPLIF